jgi:hypothetical protein
MCKNTILKTAINASLALPRQPLWATVAVVATVSFMAVGSPAVYAGAGSFENDNGEGGKVAADGQFASATGIMQKTVTATKALGPFPDLVAPVTMINRVDGGEHAKDFKTQGATEPAAQVDKEYPLTSAVVYASELFTSGNPVIPSGTEDFQVVKYVVGGDIVKKFNISFELSGGAQFSGAYLALDEAGTAAPTLGPAKIGCVSGSPSGAIAKYTVTVDTNPTASAAAGASCSIRDGTEIYLAYRMSGVATTLKAGGTIEMTAKVTGDNPAVPLNPTRTIPVATSISASKVEVVPELGRLGYVFVSTADDNKLFVDKSPATETGDTPFISDELVTIGYVKVTSKDAVDATGRTLFALGSTGDAGTLEITNGQFSASPGGVGAKGSVYIDAGGAIEAISPLEENSTKAKWALTASNLKSISDTSAVAGSKGAPIKVKVDRSSEIKDVNTEVGQAPVANMTITPNGQTSSIAVGPSELRRIPRDGKTCWVFNVPPPDGNLDLLSVRITNDTAKAGSLTGTLYPEAGGDPPVPDALNVNLLAKIALDAADSRNKVIEMVNDASGTPVPALKGGSTIRLSSKDIADAGDVASWTGERKVLKIKSEISELEVMTLLRYGGEDPLKAPQSNVSTGVTGNSCE